MIFLFLTVIIAAKQSNSGNDNKGFDQQGESVRTRGLEKWTFLNQLHGKLHLTITIHNAALLEMLSQLSSHHNLALIKLIQISILWFFPASTTKCSCALIHPPLTGATMKRWSLLSTWSMSSSPQRGLCASCRSYKRNQFRLYCKRWIFLTLSPTSLSPPRIYARVL